jgi:hypothetical protein
MAEGKTFDEKLGKALINYLPILTIVSLAIGLISQLVYYYPFHLDILNYLDINEVLLSTFTNLLKCLATVLFWQFLADLFLFIRIKMLKINDEKDKRLYIKLTYKKVHILILSLIAVLTFIFIRYYNIFDNAAFKPIIEEWHMFSWAAYIIGVLFVTLPYLKHIYETNYFIELSGKYITIGLSSLGILFYTILYSADNANNTSLLSTYGSYIEVGSKKIVSSAHHYYIGRTKNFIFFYDAKWM